MKRTFTAILLLLAAVPVFAENSKQEAVNVGYLSNITHAQAILGRADGTFEKSVDSGHPIRWTVFNAGPSVIEALFAGKIDIAYIGPSPAVNGFVKSHGEALRVVAGSASGGAALVVRRGAGIETAGDFHGKKIASPQLGNTQDVSLRAWISHQGLALKGKGGDVQVLPMANADQVTLFLRKEIDAAWTVEPWVSILLQNADGKIFLDESSLWPDGRYATTLLIVRKDYLDRHPEVVKAFLKAHLSVTRWILEHETESKKLLNPEIEKLTHKAIPEAVMNEAFKRIHFTWDPLPDTVRRQAEAATQAGFLRSKPDLGQLFDLKLLNELESDKI